VLIAILCGEAGKNGKRPRIGGNVLRWLKFRARFAGIGIDPDDQELGRQRAEIDASAEQRLRLVEVPLRPTFAGLIVLLALGSLGITYAVTRWRSRGR